MKEMDLLTTVEPLFASLIHYSFVSFVLILSILIFTLYTAVCWRIMYNLVLKDVKFLNDLFYGEKSDSQRKDKKKK